MEFELGIDAVCNAIKAYEEIMNSLTGEAKAVDNVMKELMDANWSGAAKEQFQQNVKTWQMQMGKFLEDMQFINNAFAEILNAKSINLQKQCDSFEECIRK